MAFYKALAKEVTDAKSRAFLIGMAKEESQHEKNFEKMLRDKGSATYGWEKEKTLRKLIETHFQTDIFPNLNEILKQLPKFEGIQKAFEFAIESEKVAAEFYSLLGEFCNNFEAKTLLLQMEKTERDHLLQVEALKKQCEKESKKK